MARVISEKLKDIQKNNEEEKKKMANLKIDQQQLEQLQKLDAINPNEFSSDNNKKAQEFWKIFNIHKDYDNFDYELSYEVDNNAKVTFFHSFLDT